MKHPLDPESYLANLTPTQREAVLCTDGPLLILAGPGSGKTRVITTRIAHLVHEGVRPYQILAITFTNKAAQEMRQRVGALLPVKGMWISTFHALGVRLLRAHADRLGIERNFTIYDQADRLRVVKNALDSADIDGVRFTPDTIQGAISKAKNQLLTPGKYASGAGDFFAQVVAQVYEVYEKKMRAANAFDYDDLLLWPALALKNDPELRAELDARFRYVLVDEYQDTNKAQYAIARGLSQDYPNLCVVGDPDQSIYKWRGADIRNILDFERDFPSAKVITLSENFRSTQTILQVADELIAHNKQRKPKTLTTANPVGSAVHVLEFENALDEADAIVQRIRADVDQGKRHYRDFALFVRINALSRNLERSFIHARVPYQIVRGLAFFDRKENKDIISYLRLLTNPRDDVSFARVVNEPARGVGKVSLDHLQAYAEPREMSLLSAIEHLDSIPAIKGKAANGLRNFADLIEELRKLLEFPPDEIIRQVIHQTGYHAMLKNSDDEYDEERLANIEELITAAKQFANLPSEERESNLPPTLEDFLENITLASDVDSWDEKQDCVSIMTLHAAKGLEFPVVCMLAMEQGILPHERSLVKDEDLEEERRLAFVGITRAKEELYLSHCRMREYRGQTLYGVASMFLDEIPEKGVEVHSSRSHGSHSRSGAGSWAESPGWKDIALPRTEYKTKKPQAPARGTSSPGGNPAEFSEGALVHHETYGVGRIAKVMGHGAARKLKIRFTKAGERTFLADKVKLVIVQGT